MHTSLTLPLQRKPADSLRPVADLLKTLLAPAKVEFADDCVGPAVEAQVSVDCNRTSRW